MYLGLNEKAWSGIDLMIFGKTPLLPMKIEQSIAQASPENEIRTNSFEDFDQAYDFCKQQKTIGLIFILENSGQPIAADTFRSFATHYESKGWPCFGVLIGETSKSMLGYLSMQKSKNLIAYYTSDDLTNPTKVHETLNEVWKSFVAAFELAVAPERLQETLQALAAPTLTKESFDFKTRIGVLLTHNLNISWLESVALKWEPVIQALQMTCPKALESNQALVQISKLSQSLEGHNDIAKIAGLKDSLCSRVATVVRLLDQYRIENALPQVLKDLQTLARPGSPALLRKVATSTDQILAIASDYKQFSLGEVG